MRKEKNSHVLDSEIDDDCCDVLMMPCSFCDRPDCFGPGDLCDPDDFHNPGVLEVWEEY